LRACTDVTVRLSETTDAIINSYMLVACLKRNSIIYEN
jgi:hypothetical protein